MFSHNILKYIACLVLVSYISICIPSGIFAAESPLTVNPQLFAQVASPRTVEEEQALRQIYANKIQRLDAEINHAKGVRKNLLTIAVGAFSAAGVTNFAVNRFNGAIDDIPVENPEGQPTDACVEIRYGECCQYISYAEEKRDAQDALDGIKGIGGGIFIVGATSLIGYYLYTRMIKGREAKIDALQAKTSAGFEAKGLTPEYLQKNEAVAALLEEADTLKSKAGSARTIGEIFSRLAIGSLVGGAFLFGVSMVSHDIIEDINVDEDDPEDIQAKEDALDQTDTMKTVGLVLLGTGAVSGITSFLIGRWAKGKEAEASELEDSLLGIAGRIDIQPRSNGFMVVYTHTF